MGSNTIGINKLKRLKVGLGIISFGIILILITASLSFIGGIIYRNDPIALEKFTSIVNITSTFFKLLYLVGIFVCLLSQEKHFKIALCLYLITIIWNFVFVILKAASVSYPLYLSYLSYLFEIFAMISIILGIKNANNSFEGNKFNNLIITLCLILYILVSILKIYGTIKENNTFITTASGLYLLSNFLFLLAIFRTNRLLKKNLN